MIRSACKLEDLSAAPAHVDGLREVILILAIAPNEGESDAIDLLVTAKRKEDSAVVDRAGGLRGDDANRCNPSSYSRFAIRARRCGHYSPPSFIVASSTI